MHVAAAVPADGDPLGRWVFALPGLGAMGIHPCETVLMPPAVCAGVHATSDCFGQPAADTIETRMGTYLMVSQE